MLNAEHYATLEHDAAPLSRRPSHSAAAKHVDVEMVHGLAAVLACVHYRPVPGLRDALLNRHLSGKCHQMAEQRLILGMCH